MTKNNFNYPVSHIIIWTPWDIPPDMMSQLDILWHHSYMLCMDGTIICLFQQSHKKCFPSFLQSHDCSALESQVSPCGLSYLPDYPLKRQLPYQLVSVRLILLYFLEDLQSSPHPPHCPLFLLFITLLYALFFFLSILSPTPLFHLPHSSSIFPL